MQFSCGEASFLLTASILLLLRCHNGYSSIPLSFSHAISLPFSLPNASIVVFNKSRCRKGHPHTIPVHSLALLHVMYLLLASLCELPADEWERMREGCRFSSLSFSSSFLVLFLSYPTYPTLERGFRRRRCIWWWGWCQKQRRKAVSFLKRGIERDRKVRSLFSLCAWTTTWNVLCKILMMFILRERKEETPAVHSLAIFLFLEASEGSISLSTKKRNEDAVWKACCSSCPTFSSLPLLSSSSLLFLSRS